MNTVKMRARLPTIPGARASSKNAQLLISSGLPSLDNLIGGGLPVGSLLLIEQDTFDHHAKIVLRYFMAEGVVTSQSLLIASQDVEPVQFMSELPAVVEDTEHHEEPESKTDELMKIAWRYQNMKAVDTSLAGGQSFGHFYDLTQTIDSDLLKAASIKQWHECDPRKQSDMFTNPAYCDLLACIQDTLSDGQYLLSDNPSERKILRIALHSLGSRLWLSDTEDASNHDLFKFLYCFRALLRNSYAVGVVTVPVNNFDDDTVIGRLEHMSDIAIKLESFAGSAKETNPLFKDYHGLFHLNKLPALSSLAPHSPTYRDLAFKLRRKKFMIEVLHLPPEFDDTPQREQDEMGDSTIGCMSGSRKNPLDF